jgi:hypothetical protein
VVVVVVPFDIARMRFIEFQKELRAGVVLVLPGILRSIDSLVALVAMEEVCGASPTEAPTEYPLGFGAMLKHQPPLRMLNMPLSVTRLLRNGGGMNRRIQCSIHGFESIEPTALY